MADEHGQVREYPRGFVPAWGLLFGGAVALVVFHLVHQPDGSPPSQAAPRPGSTVTATATPSFPATHSSLPVLLPEAGGEQHAAANSGAPPISQRTGPSAPSPSPSQSPNPSRAPGVKAAVVVSLRGATPVAVRAAVVAPSAPPDPSPGAWPTGGVEVSLTVQGIAVTALP